MASGALPVPGRSQTRPWDVLCLGLNAVDHLCLILQRPAWGGKLRMSGLDRLGLRVAYAGICGDDDAGRQAASWLREFGVEPRGLKIKPDTQSQQAFIMVEQEGGERTIVWNRDEACHLGPEDLDPDLITGCRVLHLDGHFWEASLKAAELARAAGAVVNLDAERVFEGTAELVSRCQVVVGCQDFAQRLMGIEEPRRALLALAGLGPAWVGRTLGPQGAELLVKGQYYRHPGFAVRAVDTTGAGDVVHAGLVHAILLGQGPQEALATANAAAAISVTGLGGRAALPSRPELEAFLAAHRQQP